MKELGVTGDPASEPRRDVLAVARLEGEIFKGGKPNIGSDSYKDVVVRLAHEFTILPPG